MMRCIEQDRDSAWPFNAAPEVALGLLADCPLPLVLVLSSQMVNQGFSEIPRLRPPNNNVNPWA